MQELKVSDLLRRASTYSLEQAAKGLASATHGFGAGTLQVDGSWFKDSTGRTIMLRGVNVSGNAKLPSTPYMPSHVRDGFFDDATVSFVGRPFPLAEADEHFARLHSWGFNFIRLNITWEALEHAGPEIYDFEFMLYITELLQKAKRHKFRVFIDPHQDVWSRFSGGSGAPGWTLRKAGLDVTKFAATNAAIVHNTYPDPDNYPKMIWPTNYYKLAAASMFTLFFGGKTFAPSCTVDGVNIEEFLQSHYCNAFATLAKKIKEVPGLEDDVVIGYDTLNEPSPGLIGCPDLSKLDPRQELKKGLTPTFFQAMLLGEGIKCDVDVWEFTSFGPRKQRTDTVDPAGTSAWLSQSGGCIWAGNGVWDRTTGTLLRPEYFTKHPKTNQPVDFLSDHWMPFVRRFTNAIRGVHPGAIMFIEPPVNEHPPVWNEAAGDPVGRLCYAPHWYDGLTLISKHFNTWYNVDYIGFLRGKYSHPAFGLKLGDAGIRAGFKSQLKTLRDEGLEYMGEYPCVFGEIGIPYDMDNRISYLTGDYTAQTQALDCNMHALETNLLNFTLWNYCPDNSHQWGDGWNGEDLSIWSPALPRRKGSAIAEKANVKIPPMDVNRVGPLESQIGKTSCIHEEQAGSIEGCGLPVGQDSDYLDQGGRAIPAFARPYPVLTPGTPMSLHFDLHSGVFTYTFRHSLSSGLWATPGLDPSSKALETELYVPREHYHNAEQDAEVWVSEGLLRWDQTEQRLYWRCGCDPGFKEQTIQSGNNEANGEGGNHDLGPGVEHTIVIKKRVPGAKPLSVLAKEAREKRLEGTDEKDARVAICPTPTNECVIL
ncbi:hypothetical protein SpCBS45565_g05895 [Spizellomyces sp. 'palustris']|nr:hypothetical protein SpCBS45565_g05895 [Spizellomyces sp. 'palustris']